MTENLALDLSQKPLLDDVFVFPASFAQERLWFLDKLEPGNSLYNVPFAARISGKLNVKTLEKSFAQLIARHEILRTVFSVDENDNLIQVVSLEPDFRLPVQDWGAVPEGSTAFDWQQRIVELARKPFDLARGPLMRVELLRLGEDGHILSLTLHHTIVDGWSWPILLEELATLYEAFADGKPSSLPEPPIQYGDYAAWQKDSLQGEHLEELQAYWKRQLENAPGILELATDFSRPAVQTYRGDTESVVLPKDLLRRVEKFALTEGCTLFMVLLSAYNLLLSRYTHQDDIVVGTPVAGRDRSELEPLIGLFVNILALRTDLSGNPAFRELLRRVRETTLGAYAHQELPFEKLVRELQPERSLSHSPLFQAMFILQNLPRKAITIPGLTLSPLEINSGRRPV
ncbi:MAG: hypothetical protein DMG96_24850 [Acidobacteria bacterium]|nr:MAG: hypothetical protein DMG96_24850 [Acidobacteriota bacterium]